MSTTNKATTTFTLPSEINKLTVGVSWFDSIKTSTARFELTHLGNVYYKLKNPQEVASKELAPLWTFRNFIGDRRSNNNALMSWAVVFDFDHGGVSPEDFHYELGDIVHLWHTTLSHQPGNAEKYRLIIPFTEPVPSKYLPEIQARLLRKTGFAPHHDEATKDLARIYYVPAITAKSTFDYASGFGGLRLLNVAEDLELHIGQMVSGPVASTEFLDVSDKPRTVHIELPNHADYEVDPHNAKLNVGERNSGLFHGALDLLTNNIPEKVVYAYLVDANKNRCATPVEEKELRSILSSAVKFLRRKKEQQVEKLKTQDVSLSAPLEGKTKPRPKAKPSKELAIILYITEALGGRENCIFDGLDLRTYNQSNGIWEKTSEAAVEKLVQQFLPSRYSLRLVRKVYEGVCFQCTRENFQFNQQPRAIPFTNCTVRWDEQSKKMIVGDKRRDDYFTYTLPHAYIEPSVASTPAFDRFLSSLFEYNPATFDARATSIQRLQEISDDREDICRALWEAIGYTLTGDTSLEISFWFLGNTGANGKSTLANLLRHVVGVDNSVAGTIEVLTARFGISLLQDKLYFLASEISSEEDLRDGTLKQIISGEPVILERKGQDARQYNPRAKFWFLFNTFPQLKDYSGGFQRRVAIWEFVNTFRGKNRDPRLLSKLQAEAGAIASRAVAHLEVLYARGYFQPSEAMIAIQRQWRGVNDALQGFIEEQVIVSDAPNTQVTIRALYKNYQLYCDENGCNRMSKRRFILRFAQEVPQAYKVRCKSNMLRDEYVFLNIKLRSIEEADLN